MSAYLDHLKSLSQKMQVGYGADDAIVLHLQQALDAREAIELRDSWWFGPRVKRRTGDTPQWHLETAMGG
ncbi:MAG: hypothetical protein Q7U13_05460 [Rhodoferax sp.]|nr:hypothetical protein [Rhodoferax sp.]